jgi:hypothetical protein
MKSAIIFIFTLGLLYRDKPSISAVSPVTITHLVSYQDSRFYSFSGMLYESNWQYFRIINNQMVTIPADNGLDEAKDLWKGIVNDVAAVTASCYLKYADIAITRKDGSILKLRLPRLNLTMYAKQGQDLIDFETKTKDHCILMFSDGNYAASVANFR